MALDSYTAIQASIAGFLGGRTDLTAVIPDFITLAERKIARKLRRKTLRASVTFNTAVFTIPADVSLLRSLRLVTSTPSRDDSIAICSPEQLNDARKRANAVAGRPAFAAVVGTELMLAPAPDQSYTAEITYFEKLVPLSATNATNSALIDSPDLYLFGALTEAAKYLEHDERIAVWQTTFDDAIADCNNQRRDEEFNASLRPVRLPVVFG